MKNFKQYLAERFVNLFTTEADEEQRRQYADAVWDILQATYKPIGGIKGSGFASKDDMIRGIPFWKLVVKDGEVHGCVMYKDKGGRKLVAAGYKEGSEYGRLKVIEISKHDLTRAYGEKSKGSLGSIMKQVPWPLLEPLLIKPRRSDKTIPVTELKPNEVPEDGQLTLKKYPHLRPYSYVRIIGGEYVFKVSMGTLGKELY